MRWTKAFVKDGAMVGRDTMAAALSSGTVVGMAEKSVASWTGTAAETTMVCS